MVLQIDVQTYTPGIITDHSICSKLTVHVNLNIRQIFRVKISVPRGFHLLVHVQASSRSHQLIAKGEVYIIRCNTGAPFHMNRNFYFIKWKAILSFDSARTTTGHINITITYKAVSKKSNTVHLMGYQHR